MKVIKGVVVGYNAVGKTYLLYTNCHNSFPDEYIFSIFDDFSVDIDVNDQSIKFILFETQHIADELNHLLYQMADVFIICFSLVNKYSLENVENYWFHELRQYSPNKPFILVGTKSDLRDDFIINEDRYKSRGMMPISKEEGEEMKTRIGANKYIECSSKKQINVKEVFYEAAQIALHHKNITKRTYRKTEENSCCIIC